MIRTAVYSALILRCRAGGGASAARESSREIHMLTIEEGIIKATVFGGPKSKLRAHTAPYNSGRIWIYRNPIKESIKINDFDVHSWRPGLRELYERSMTAGAVAEIILASHGGGSTWDEAMKLAISALDALENANEELCARILVHFLWRWAGFLGLQPQIENCTACRQTAADKTLWYSPRENCVLCVNCVIKDNFEKNPPGFLQLNPGCRRWFTAAGALDSSLLHRYSMDSKSFNEAKSFAYAVLSEAFDKQPASWNWQ
jgi:DNA repair protein RecO (recombination protein O)